MAGKYKEATSERLVEVMLTGGPRVSRDACSELRDRLREGQDVVSLLPAPEGLDGVNRRRVFSLLRSALIRRKDGPGLLALLSRQSDKELGSSMLDLGNYIQDQTLVAVLVDKVCARTLR